MKTSTNWLLLVLISGFIISGCSPRAKYERRLKQELARGVRYDSLFLGLYFGMPERDFYPNFNQGKIFEMPVTFKYKGWAPWNKALSSDNLQNAVQKWYEKVYGKG